MGVLIKLPAPGQADKPAKASGPQPKPSGTSVEGLRTIEVTPRVIGIVLAVLVLVGGIWFAVGRAASSAASTPMMDTTTDSRGPDTTHANGMDTSTETPGGASTGGGMDTSTGR